MARRDGIPAEGTDEALMVRIQTGDEQALATLMGRYRGPLYGFLVRRVGDAADDVFQESWIRVVRARDRFDPGRRFSTWLFQIANNLCRDRYRRRQARSRAVEAFGHEARTLAEPVGEPVLDGDAGMRERVLALPERQREVLLLRYYEDLGEAEIAEVLDIPRGTVKSRLHAAVKSLREAFAASGEEDA